MERKEWLLVIGILIIGGIDLLIWKRVLCPQCLASKQGQERKVISESFVEEEEEEDSLEEQKLAQAQQIDSPAPNFVLENLDDNKVSLSDFRGKNVLLIYWDSTCGWCEEEREDLIRFTQEQKGRIEVLAFSREDKETLKKYVKEKGINFTILLDPEGRTQADYLAIGTPNHFLIDKQSKIAAIRPGYANYDNLLELVQAVKD